MDDACDDRVLAGDPVPAQMFDRALRVLHESVRTRREPDHDAIPALFDERPPVPAGARAGYAR